MKLIRPQVCHNVFAKDELNGGWHDGFRRDGSERIAFFFRRQWWASDSAINEDAVLGPFDTKTKALMPA